MRKGNPHCLSVPPLLSTYILSRTHAHAHDTLLDDHDLCLYSWPSETDRGKLTTGSARADRPTARRTCLAHTVPLDRSHLHHPPTATTPYRPTTHTEQNPPRSETRRPMGNCVSYVPNRPSLSPARTHASSPTLPPPCCRLASTATAARSNPRDPKQSLHSCSNTTKSTTPDGSPSERRRRRRSRPLWQPRRRPVNSRPHASSSLEARLSLTDGFDLDFDFDRW